MYSPPHYHSRAKLKALTPEEGNIYGFIPLVEKKKRIHEMIIVKYRAERDRLIQ
jgi:hypothetical protein